ncbi:hypothetical protein CR513_17275, partial [Mucuna pruriens]
MDNITASVELDPRPPVKQGLKPIKKLAICVEAKPVAQKKEDRRRQEKGHGAQNNQAQRGRVHQGGQLHNVTVQRGIGKEEQREVEDMCGLHKPQQGCPQGLLPPTEHRSTHQRGIRLLRPQLPRCLFWIQSNKDVSPQ